MELDGQGELWDRGADAAILTIGWNKHSLSWGWRIATRIEGSPWSSDEAVSGYAPSVEQAFDDATRTLGWRLFS